MKTALLTRTVLIALAIAAPLAASAGDTTIARLVEANGSVLVSADSTIVSGQASQRLVPGSRVLTTASATAVVEYDNGCRVSLAPGERFRVSPQSPCAARSALPHRADRSLLTTSVGR